MTSWAVVCDVWFLEPQTKQPNETPEQFSERVKVRAASTFLINFYLSKMFYNSSHAYQRYFAAA